MTRNEEKPDDDAGSAGASVLDQEVAAQPPAAKNKGVRVKQTPKGVQVTIPQSSQEAAPAAEAAPAQAAEEKSSSDPTSMVEIDNVKPKLAEALSGHLSIDREGVNEPICVDGLSPALTGMCGDVPDSPAYKMTVEEKWGGGVYIARGVTSKGKSGAVRFTIAGKSKPIPGTPGYRGAPVDPYAPGASAYSMPGYPQGYAAPPYSAPGYSAPYSAPGYGAPYGYGAGYGLPAGYGAGYASPWGAPADDEEKKALREKLAETERKVELEKLERAYDTKLDRVLKEIGGGGGKQDVLAMMKAEQDARQLQYQRDKDADDRRYRDQKDAEDRRYKEQQDERRERERREDAARTAEATARTDTIKLQIAAMDKSSQAAGDAAKEIARIQSESSKQLITVLMAKNEEGGIDKMFDRVAKFSGMMAGDKSEAERIMGMIPAMADSVLPRLADAFTTVKTGMSSGGGSGGPQDDDEKTIRVISVAVKSYSNGVQPMDALRSMGAAALAMDLDFAKVRSLIGLIETAPPAMAGPALDKVAANRPPEMQAKVAEIKAMVMDPNARAWILAINAILKGQAPAPQVSAKP